MLKRNRKEFEADGKERSQEILQKKRKTETSTTSGMSSEFECPVCYEEFTGAIYQCAEGHLLCDACKPKFTHCPICSISLSSDIRNRVLEHLLSTKPTLSAAKNKNNDECKNSNNNNRSEQCKFCHVSFDERLQSVTQVQQHYHECESRPIQCPFIDCQWRGEFDGFTKHASDAHHTCISSLQVVNAPKQMDDHQSQYRYVFNHSIKFPMDVFARESADFIWPKIVRFHDGSKFFVLTRYNAGFISVFVRVLRLPRLRDAELTRLRNIENLSSSAVCHNGEGQTFGQYCIEFRVKESSTHGNGVPLRWPCDLYAVTVPFNYERKRHELLRVHRNVFTKFWAQSSSGSPAILRFQFFVNLT